MEMKSNKLNIQFIDKGQGINPEELERIFVPFYRGSNQLLSSGSGIGLYLTQKIINIHKAQISVKSEITKGSVFRLSFVVDTNK
jgi:signal transduction histidine kinase